MPYRSDLPRVGERARVEERAGRQRPERDRHRRAGDTALGALPFIVALRKERVLREQQHRQIGDLPCREVREQRARDVVASPEPVELLDRRDRRQPQIDQRHRGWRDRVDAVGAHGIEPRHLRYQRRVDRIRDVERQQAQLVAGGVVQLARLADEAIDFGLEAKQLQRLEQAEELRVPTLGHPLEDRGQSGEDARQVDLVRRRARRLRGRGTGSRDGQRQRQRDGKTAYHAIIVGWIVRTRAGGAPGRVSRPDEPGTARRAR